MNDIYYPLNLLGVWQFNNLTGALDNSTRSTQNKPYSSPSVNFPIYR